MTDQPRNGNGERYRWLITPAIVILGFAMQWGIQSAQMAELTRRVESLERKLDDRMLPRDEYEKRHEELEKRYDELHERVQQLEMKRLH